eukprot:2087200-Prymnesium_polylepis.1
MANPRRRAQAEPHGTELFGDDIPKLLEEAEVQELGAGRGKRGDNPDGDISGRRVRHRLPALAETQHDQDQRRSPAQDVEDRQDSHPSDYLCSCARPLARRFHLLVSPFRSAFLDALGGVFVQVPANPDGEHDGDDEEQDNGKKETECAAEVHKIWHAVEARVLHDETSVAEKREQGQNHSTYGRTVPKREYLPVAQRLERCDQSLVPLEGDDGVGDDGEHKCEERPGTVHLAGWPAAGDRRFSRPRDDRV